MTCCVVCAGRTAAHQRPGEDVGAGQTERLPESGGGQLELLGLGNSLRSLGVTAWVQGTAYSHWE